MSIFTSVIIEIELPADTGLLYNIAAMRRSLVTLFAPDYCIFASLFPLYRVVAATHQKIWKASMMHFSFTCRFYSLKRYTCRAMCAGGRDEIMEKYGVGILHGIRRGALLSLASRRQQGRQEEIARLQQQLAD